MPFIWQQEEKEKPVYKNVERHSPGMISFTYKPPSPELLEELKNTETYRLLHPMPEPPASNGSKEPS